MTTKGPKHIYAWGRKRSLTSSPPVSYTAVEPVSSVALPERASNESMTAESARLSPERSAEVTWKEKREDTRTYDSRTMLVVKVTCWCGLCAPTPRIPINGGCCCVMAAWLVEVLST